LVAATTSTSTASIRPGARHCAWGFTCLAASPLTAPCLPGVSPSVSSERLREVKDLAHGHTSQSTGEPRLKPRALEAGISSVCPFKVVLPRRGRART
jgi:hypothetical protein